MKLKGDKLKEVRRALKEAFPASTNQLDLVVANADIGKQFAEFQGDYEFRINNLLLYAVGGYHLVKLLRAAVEEAPDNPELAEVTAFVRAYFVSFSQLLDGVDKQRVDVFERTLFKDSGFQDVLGWIDKLERIMRRVCRIEPQPQASPNGIGGYGTGFLVGPDVILTNDHVASGENGRPGFWDDRDKAALVKVRFDYMLSSDGRVGRGKAYGLAKDYQVLRSPSGHLDFALIRLDSREGYPSEDIVGGRPRGYVTPVAHAFENEEPLLIIQHPKAEPMKLTFGSLTPKERWAEDRIAYKVNTEGGSSGSPCLTQGLEVGAIHHQGSFEDNRGVLMSSLFTFWSDPNYGNCMRSAGLAHLIRGNESVRNAPGEPLSSPVADASQSGPSTHAGQGLETQGTKSDRLLSRSRDTGRRPRVSKIRVLIVAVNLPGQAYLRLDEEIREITNALKKSNSQGFHLEVRWAVRMKDLRSNLLAFEPHIVHFSGHGDREGIMLVDDSGQVRKVPAAWLAGLFGLFPDRIHCVIFNACFTDDVAKAVSHCTSYVIGLSTTISDESASRFSSGFYEAIAFGKAVPHAFEFGMSAIQEGMYGNDRPILIQSKPSLNDPKLPPSGSDRIRNRSRRNAKRLLILAVNPRGTPTLNLGEEVREIYAELQDKLNDGRYVIEQSWATRPADFQRALAEFKPHLVHYSGVGHEGGIAFEGPTGEALFVDGNGLSLNLELYGKSVEFFTFIACGTAVLADRAIAP